MIQSAITHSYNQIYHLYTTINQNTLYTLSSYIQIPKIAHTAADSCKLRRRNSQTTVSYCQKICNCYPRPTEAEALIPLPGADALDRWQGRSSARPSRSIRLSGSAMAAGKQIGSSRTVFHPYGCRSAIFF